MSDIVYNADYKWFSTDYVISCTNCRHVYSREDIFQSYILVDNVFECVKCKRKMKVVEIKVKGVDY